MKLLLRFLKPHWKLCVLTVVLLFVDVAGSLFIPTLVAEMLNAGTSGAAFQSIVTTGIQMAVISAVAGLGAIAGGYACATLTAQVAKDMRQAIYTKSLKLSVSAPPLSLPGPSRTSQRSKWLCSVPFR